MHGYADGITSRHEAEIHKGNSKVQRDTFMNAFLFLKNIYYVSWSLKYQPDIIGFVPNQQGPTVAGCANVWRRSLSERQYGTRHRRNISSILMPSTIDQTHLLFYSNLNGVFKSHFLNSVTIICLFYSFYLHKQYTGIHITDTHIIIIRQ